MEWNRSGLNQIGYSIVWMPTLESNSDSTQEPSPFNHAVASVVTQGGPLEEEVPTEPFVDPDAEEAPTRGYYSG